MILNRQLFDLKLKSLREFQQKYPTSHVGGSIGLFLRGIDLQRDLSNSDLDITIDEYEFDSSVSENVRETSHDGDFDLICKVQPNDSKYHVKIEIRICPEPSYTTVPYEGYLYNVSKLRDILYLKIIIIKKKS